MSVQGAISRRGFFQAAGALLASAAIPASLWGCGGDVEFANPAAYDFEGGDEGPEPNEAWEDRARGLEEILYTAEDPGPWAEKIDVHVPMIELHDGEGAATVTVMHGMSVEHWISDIYIRNQDDIIIGYVELTGEDPEARARFDLPRGTTRITAYAYCNLHDHWTADSVRV